MSTQVLAHSSAPSPTQAATPPAPSVASTKHSTPPPPDISAGDDLDDDDRKPLVLTPGSELPADLHSEYAAGHVLCGACGVAVSFRDEKTGEFTVGQWEAHRLSCPHAGSASTPPRHYNPTTYMSTNSQAPKRRRAKRTEEERIAYLKADTHIAQFEAYRVLCASCSKWIRLRPNSTYCSIPWDAHRKSCLAKKAGALSTPTNSVPRPPPAYSSAFDEITRDVDVRRVESDRIMCGICEKWLALPDNPSAAIQVWHTHREDCQKTTSSLRSTAPSVSSAPKTPNPQHSHSPQPNGGHHPVHLPLPDAPHVVLDLSPANYAAPHESRRRNAEQRAATLRADLLIRAVEPNRVFCSLCTKWVQLRQDSSFCAYPWLQHRGKCLARYQRRTQKAGDMTGSKGQTARRLIPAPSVRPEDELESEEGVGRQTRAPPPVHPPRNIPGGYVPTVGNHQTEGEADIEGDDVDADGDSYMEDEPPSARQPAHDRDLAAAIIRRTVPANLADLDSPNGRRNFIFASVDYLFHTTHENSDDLSVGALLTYVNAAMPIDKHEDFDMVEVVRVASTLQESSGTRYRLEGDMIRVHDE
ncbi:hypothetical protein MIND_00208700 [Mycena indigotica]|uniref:Uncharacterized protein n=1 Tax=Mycena indigotica TaxID=2126181 RepID=A0A8H6T6T9_9AGAR|nr:uncharacterized protein MIND_00208700 [Mycena indigotica]KAF7311970.1 hypothetical protein MIND_00208700 [Mycena indigotica]